MSGLAVDTEYVFHLVLRTSAGSYSSEKLAVRTHKMTDLSGITVTPGVLPAPLRESLTGAVDRIGGKIVENVRIDTTHFVCMEGRGREWEKAQEMNIPIVRPEWVEGCEREGRIVGVRGYYLNADPRLRQVGQGVGMLQQQQQRPSQPQRRESERTPVPVQERQQQDLPTPPQRQPQSTTMLPPPSPSDGPSSNGEDSRPPPPEKDHQPAQERLSADRAERTEEEDESQAASPTKEEHGDLGVSAAEDENAEGTQTPADVGSFDEVKL